MTDAVFGNPVADVNAKLLRYQQWRDGLPTCPTILELLEGKLALAAVTPVYLAVHEGETRRAESCLAGFIYHVDVPKLRKSGLGASFLGINR